MSLRTRILLLFGALAIAPILAVGVLDHMHSIRALDQLVRAKVEGSTEHAARTIAERHGRMRSDAQRLAELPEVGRLLRAARVGDGAELAAARDDMDRIQRETWPEFREHFASIELVDPWGRLIHRIADTDPTNGFPPFCPDAAPVSTLEWPVVDRVGRAGTLVAVPRFEALLPFGLLEARYGARGHTFVVDRETGAVVHARYCGHVGQPLEKVLATLDLTVRGDWWRLADEKVTGADDDDAFVALISIGSPPWTVATIADVGEFTAAYARLRAGYLLFVLFIAVVAAGAFSILLSGVMRSLRQLGEAADRIGAGDFNPWLPPPTGDEVGRLSLAIATMANRLRQSRRQIEVSRQMAAVGKMAAFLAHEIRNPLSSIRLNLQAIVREARDGGQPEDLPEILDLCLTEVRRLDTTVHGVLSLSRARDVSRRPSSIHRILDEVLELMGHQLDRRNVRVDILWRAPHDRVEANEEQIKGVLMNLLLNAAAAMRDGGRVRIWTAVVDRRHAGDALSLHVRDEGPGVPPELRDRIFEPFFTTRRSGTGIGLPLSLQIAEEHGGRFYLAENGDVPGAEFVLELPLMDAAAAARLDRERPAADDDPAPFDGGTYRRREAAAALGEHATGVRGGKGNGRGRTMKASSRIPERT